MTAMVEEVANISDANGDYGDDYGDDHTDDSIPEMFRSTSGLLDSLDRLTSEIKAGLEEDSVSGSNESSSNGDGDAYWSDEDNYDSGENKLFSMMDELVNELMIELKHDTDDEHGEASKTVADEEIGESSVSKGEQAGEITKDDDETATKSVVSAQPTIVSEDATPNPNVIEPIDEPVDKQEKLHEHVKTLLGQVTELNQAMNTMKKTKAVKNEYNDKISANIQRKIEQGDYDADRLEHLMGAIATYSKFREAKINAIPTLSSPTSAPPCATVSVKKKKRRKRTNKHKRRRSKSFVQTQQSLLILSDSLAALDEKLSQGRR
mmetsp:Transcript_7503/g.18387  ORF Transcript_7503/g.18387 Transcript_7503/m.18387 type:complete len:321 (+) Transcript_7503:105-1067(+)